MSLTVSSWAPELIFYTNIHLKKKKEQRTKHTAYLGGISSWQRNAKKLESSSKTCKKILKNRTPPQSVNLMRSPGLCTWIYKAFEYWHMSVRNLKICLSEIFYKNRLDYWVFRQHFLLLLETGFSSELWRPGKKDRHNGNIDRCLNCCSVGRHQPCVHKPSQ